MDTFEIHLMEQQSQKVKIDLIIMIIALFFTFTLALIVVWKYLFRAKPNQDLNKPDGIVPQF